MSNKLRPTFSFVQITGCLGVCFMILCGVFNASAQDSLSAHSLLKQIELQQVQQDPFFLNGIFPSYVSSKKMYKEQRKDNNVFYNAIITYTLKTLKPKMTPAEQVIVDSIAARTERLTTFFRNRNGRETYNFWRTDSAYRLPYLWGMRIKKVNILDDDQDCTSMCLLASDVPANRVQSAHDFMQRHTNDRWNPAPTTQRRYKSYNAYTTWLGKKLPPVMDVCVITNVLSLVQTHNLDWTGADSSSLDMLVATIKYNDHVQNPLAVSPYYGSTSIILYHLARLMSIKPIAALESLKGRLISDAKTQLEQSGNDLEKIILSIALMKWTNDANIAWNINPHLIEKNDLPFFLGNIPSIFNRSIQKPMSRKGIGVYYHYCPAYNNVLLLEYLILKKQHKVPDLAVSQ